jgi:hypothetical protein
VNIGSAISIALLTTLYGVLTSNLIFIPLANKLKENSTDEEIVLSFNLEALKCIYDKDYTIIIEQRLAGLMPKHELLKYQSEKSEPLQLRISESIYANKMNTSPKIFNKNIDSNKIDTETVFDKRRHNSNDEESSQLLISFADLMTILLVFSFALFMVNMKESSNKSTPRKKTSKSRHDCTRRLQ